MRPEDVPSDIVEAAYWAHPAANTYAAPTRNDLRRALAPALQMYGADVLRAAAMGCRPGEERVQNMLNSWADEFNGIRMATFGAWNDEEDQ